MKRFIDDGIGCWTGSLIEFYRWFCRIYKCLSRVYNLKLTYKISPANQYIEFLDVQFCFIDGVLDTDIYYKPTDAHRYLDYNSYHPPHMFRSVVHSQAVRLRRIIIDYGLLTFRLGELAQFFIDSNYPHNMVNDVLNKVGNFDRKLEYNVKSVSTSNICVPWVSTFGPGNGELRRFVKNANATLVTSPLFNDHVLNDKPILNVVSRRAGLISGIHYLTRNR